MTVSAPDAATTTTLTVPATANVGAAVELKATVAPAAAAGTVQFKDGAANIGGPIALNAGVATLVAHVRCCGCEVDHRGIFGWCGFHGFDVCCCDGDGVGARRGDHHDVDGSGDGECGCCG